MDNLTKLRYWTFKILPLVYDDSLSYYEVLNKVTAKINELIDSNNKMPQAITDEITKQLDESYATDINNNINSAVNDVTENANNQIDKLANEVYAKLITATENANNQIDKLANEVYAKLITAIATDEGTNTFTKDAKNGGELILLNNTLYKVTAVMPAGTNYIVGTNIVPINISEELKTIKETYISSNNEYWNTRSSNSYDTNVYLYWKDVLYVTTKDIKINDILYNSGENQNLKQITLGSEITKYYNEMHTSYNNLNEQIELNKNNIRTNAINISAQDNRISNIVSQAGSDNTEIVDARTGSTKLGSTIYNSLGTAIRDQIEKALSSARLNYTTSDNIVDFNQLTEPNMIYMYNAAFTGSIINSPINENFGSSETMIINIGQTFGTGYIIHQYFFRRANELLTYYARTKAGNNTWSKWIAYSQEYSGFKPTNFNTKTGNNEVDFNKLTDSNQIWMFNKSIGIEPINAPEGIKFTNATSVLLNFGTRYGSGYLVSQYYFENANALYSYYVRQMTGNSWNNWTRVNRTTTITIGKGTPYPTLREGIEYAEKISSDDHPITVYVQPGTYNLLTEFNDQLGAVLNNYIGIPLKNGIHVIFKGGAYVTAIYNYTGNDELDHSVSTYFQPFYNAGNFILENANIEAKDVRYCVHDERNGKGDYAVKYINCVMKYTRSKNPYYFSCIGGGLGRHAHITIDGGIYTTINELGDELRPITYHNGNNAEADSTLDIKNIYFGNNGYPSFGYYGPSTHITQIYVSGCKMSREPLIRPETSDSTIINMNVTSWNNTIEQKNN